MYMVVVHRALKDAGRYVCEYVWVNTQTHLWACTAAQRHRRSAAAVAARARMSCRVCAAGGVGIAAAAAAPLHHSAHTTHTYTRTHMCHTHVDVCGSLCHVRYVRIAPQAS